MSRSKKERGKARKKKMEEAAEDRKGADAAADPGDSPEEAGSPAETPDPAAQIDELTDKLQRKTAEFLNYQKRMQREMEDVRRFAVKPLAFDLLTVADSFERALESAEGDEAGGNQDGFLEGFRMIFTQMTTAMEKSGVKPIEALNQPFDPNLHEAIMEEENPELPDRTVIDELIKGYMLHDRLLRPTTVRVSRNPGEGAAAAENDVENAEEKDEVETETPEDSTGS